MSLYKNINKRKKAGTSRPKSKSTISPKAYANMKKGFPNSKKNKAKKGLAQLSWAFYVIYGTYQEGYSPPTICT